MKPKLEDVAKSANVSLATVSRVLNNHPVRKETREKVEKAIADLHYRPNLAARSLTQNKTQTIGIVASSLVNPYHATLVHEMEITLRSAGFLSIICSSEDDPATEIDIINSMLDSQVDGIILAEATPLNANNGFYNELNNTIPLILINGNPDVRNISQVVVDQQLGMKSALEYLFTLGHKKIALLRGRFSPSFDIKEQTYRHLMANHGFDFPESYIINIREANQLNAIDEAYQNVSTLLKSATNRPTAIVAANDFLGTGALKAIQDEKLLVPNDISLINQDNTYLSTVFHLGITSIHMKMSLVGSATADMMLQLVNSENRESRKLIFYPDLVIRDSTGPVPL